MPSNIANNYVSIFEKFTSFASGIYMDDIAGMIFKLRPFHLDQHCIQPKHELNFRYLC